MPHSQDQVEDVELDFTLLLQILCSNQVTAFICPKSFTALEAVLTLKQNADSGSIWFFCEGNDGGDGLGEVGEMNERQAGIECQSRGGW